MSLRGEIESHRRDPRPHPNMRVQLTPAQLDALVTQVIAQIPGSPGFESLAGDSSSMATVVAVGRVGSADETSGNLTLTGSGESAYDLAEAATELSIGSEAKEPGRIYCEGRALMNAGQPQYLNGTNTPWINWNEFGNTVTNVYNAAQWAAELDRLVDRGINCTRVWLVCSCENTGVTLNADGTCNAPTAQFWADVDDLVAKAEARGIFLMLTAFSFDNFDWNLTNQERWVRMIGDQAAVDSLCTQYLVPLVQRYSNNPWVFSIDLGNELDWLTERGDLSTPRGGTATPVGSGSRVVNFGQRIPDDVVGMHLYVNSVDMGFVTDRNSDTQVTASNPFSSASATYTAGGGATNWTFTGFLWPTLQRYLAAASAAIHQSGSSVLVTFGQGTIKYGSALYDGDHYSDSILAALSGDGDSRLDFHSPHWYAWAAPWYPLHQSPVGHGLSAKPAIMGEMPLHYADMNCPSMLRWKPQTYYSLTSSASVIRTGLCVRVTDGTFPRIYWLLQGGLSGTGPGPQGTGTITDGDCIWLSVNNNYQPNHDYAQYDMLICDTANTDGIGRIYRCKTGGTTGNDGGPFGTGSDIALGTTVWEYVGEAVVEARTVYDYLQANGWYGHMPWMSNGWNNAFYETDLQGLYPTAWAPSEARYANEMRVNGAGFYLCITSGTTASSGGPTGTDADITDGTAHWKWIRDIANPPWTEAGIDIAEFATANYAAIHPDTSPPWDSRGTAVLQSKARAWYLSEETIRFTQRFLASPGFQSGATDKVGPFDGVDGFYLGIGGDSTVRNIWLAVMRQGAETAVERNLWSIDKLNGSGASGLVLNLDVPQTLVVDFSFRTGTKIGFLIGGAVRWAHQFDPALGSPYPSNPNLPLRWEIGAEESLSAVRALGVLSGTATSSVARRSRIRSWNNEGSNTGVNPMAVVEAWALRISPALVAWRTMRALHIRITSSSTSVEDQFTWKLCLNATPSNASTWLPATSSECVEYTRGRGLSSDGVCLASGGAADHSELKLPDHFHELLANASGGDVLSLIIQNLNSQQNYYQTDLSWDEG